MSRRLITASAFVTLLLGVSGCASSSEPSTSTETSSTQASATVTIYSGRNEELVAPLIEQITAATGVAVEVRYGDSAELAAQLLEEGDNTQADLFFSQDAGALGALANADRLAELPASTTAKVLPGYADDDGRWVATSARARVIVYSPTTAASVADLTTIDGILAPEFKGRVGIAPTNASFQSFVTALRVARGEEAAKAWLTALVANEPKIYEKNGAILDAVEKGDIAAGLVNHYYWHQKAAELGADAMTSRVHFLGTDDPGALINVAGVGILEGSGEAPMAQKVVDFLLSTPAQTYFADTTAEYAVVEGVTTTKHDLPTLTELTGSSVDLNSLDSLDATLELLETVGLT